MTPPVWSWSSPIPSLPVCTMTTANLSIALRCFAATANAPGCWRGAARCRSTTRRWPAMSSASRNCWTPRLGRSTCCRRMGGPLCILPPSSAKTAWSRRCWHAGAGARVMGRAFEQNLAIHAACAGCRIGRAAFARLVVATGKPDARQEAGLYRADDRRGQRVHRCRGCPSRSGRRSCDQAAGRKVRGRFRTGARPRGTCGQASLNRNRRASESVLSSERAGGPS